MTSADDIRGNHMLASQKYDERSIHFGSNPTKWASVLLRTPSHTEITLYVGIEFGIKPCTHNYYEGYYADGEPECDHWTKKYSKSARTIHDTFDEAYDVLIKRIERLESQGWIVIKKSTGSSCV